MVPVPMLLITVMCAQVYEPGQHGAGEVHNLFAVAACKEVDSLEVLHAEEKVVDEELLAQGHIPDILSRWCIDELRYTQLHRVWQAARRHIFRAPGIYPRCISSSPLSSRSLSESTR